ncbi:MAG: gliding motility lipoprotein GldJ [Cytophagales bacterium]|nr:gliding motility lipoprotein GldJ [Bernardetiaceae bacterium]MDW8211569.1 gliding motility lipoprotein GldJ [Cytophagales bacterium]
MFALLQCGGKKPTSVDPGKQSTTTGLKYSTGGKNKNNEFAVRKFKGQPEGPNLVYIEGGRHILGAHEEDVPLTRDNIERTVTVASFYMDETEVANIHWLEYLHYVRDSGEQYYTEALPDTTVWAAELAFNDPYIDHYLRYPGFRFFPVVGVSWRQAVNYCVWRTEAVNRGLALKNGNKEEKAAAKAGERIPLESGIVLPGYRLPTEAEWEYAAKGLIATQYLDEMQDYSRLYPWDGHSLRNPYGRHMGEFLANFKRGRGDYAGIAGKLNDGAMITEWIYAYPPNDYGLYNMAGNVNEWVEDIYRPLSFEDVSDLNPVRTDGKGLHFAGGFRPKNADYLDPASYYNKRDFFSIIDNKQRVYKGGSWKDVAYWLAIGTRRFLDEDSATATIGFRCAMIRAGGNK